MDNKFKVRNLVTSIYDIQQVRIAVGNRIVSSFNIQMGQEPSTSQEDMDKESQAMIKSLRSEYKRLTDAYIEGQGSIKKLIKENQKDLAFIRSDLDYKLIEHYESLIKSEEGMVKLLTKEVEQAPIYKAFLKDVKGCGPLMSGVLISYLDIRKARHVASFWKYAGLDTVPVVDGKAVHLDDTNVVDGTLEADRLKEVYGKELYYEGRSRKHVEMQKYTAKDGTEKEKLGLTFNPFLKTKLLGVLGGSFLKTRSPYADIYYGYKNRLQNSCKHKDKSPKHIHNMANRYMIKQFLRDLWVAWRELEGLTISEPYEVKKLGNAPHKYNECQTMKANR